MTNSLTIGKVAGVTSTKWERIWAERFREPLRVVELEEAQQRAAVLDGTVDLVFARLPIDREGLHAIPLYEEVPVVWLSKDHLLAELDEVSMADLADENVVYEATRESIELATYSAAVLRVPMSIARSLSRRDLAYRPVLDEPTTTIALAWRTDTENPLVDEFIGVVRGRTVNSSRSTAERETRTSKPRPTPTKAKPANGGRRPRRGPR